MKRKGYKLNPKKCEVFKNEIEWVGHTIDQQRNRPLSDKIEEITKINIPKKKRKRSKVILERNPIVAKIHGNSVS